MRSHPRSREISLQLSNRLRRSAYPRSSFSIFSFFSMWCFNHPRDEIIPAWIEYVLISMSINISTISTPNYSSLDVFYIPKIPKIPAKFNFSIDFSKIRFFFRYYAFRFQLIHAREKSLQNSRIHSYIQMVYRKLPLKIRLQRFQ